jgi:hypothetical protein
LFREFVLVCGLLLLFGSGARAQNTTSISGTVQDPQQSVVVGAAATLTNDKGASQTVSSSERGEYEFKELAAGTYTLTVSAPGFQDYKKVGIVLAAGQKLGMDITLEPAKVVTETTVEGQTGAQVETEESKISGTITQKELVKIGLNGRNFTQLIALAPGVSNQTGQDEAKVGVQGSVKYSVNGGRVEYNNFDVDGQDVLNAGINGSQSTLIVYPNLDSLAEVQVLTSNYGAQYGKTASGTILASTKSGGSQYHGDLFYFNRNEIFNARNFFDQTARAPLYRKNDAGFTIGGPLYIPGIYPREKSKTFFFWSEDWRIEKDPTGYTFNRAVPSLAERGVGGLNPGFGDFSDVCPKPNGISIFSRRQYPDCPAASVAGSGGNGEPVFQSFPNNLVAIDPVGQAILDAQLIPTPNSTKGCNSTISSCFDATVSPLTNWRQDLVRIDHNFTTNDKLTFRYIHDSWDTTVPLPQWAFLVNSFPTVQNDFKGPGTAAFASFSQTLSTTFLNQIGFGYTTDHITLTNIAGYGGSSTVRTPAFAAMGYIFNNGFGNKIPGISLGGNNAVYGGTGFNVDTAYTPWQHSNPTYTIREDATKVWGKHTLRFGALVLIAQRNEINPPVGSVTGDQQGIAYFSNTANLDTSGNVFADLLTGAMSAFQQDSSQEKYYQRYQIVEPYLQDDWHVTTKLTINAGLRLSLFGNWHEKYNNAYNWDPSKFNPALAETMSQNPRIGFLVDNVSGQPITLNDPRLLNGLVHCGTNGVPSGCINSHIFNPEPRIGFAWSPFGTGKTSVRGGYGIFFEHGTGDEANTGSLEGSAPLIFDGTQIYPGRYSGIGVASSPGGLLTNLVFPVNVTSIPVNTPYPYVQQWSMGIQQELPQHYIFGATYVGSKGTHLTAQLQTNQLQPTPASLNPFMPGQPISFLTCGSYSAGAAQGIDGNGLFHVNGAVIGPGDPSYGNLVAACNGHTESFPNVVALPLRSTLPVYAPNVGNIYSLENIANSSYNALQLTMRKVAGPLVLGVSYTYSHSIDDSSDRTDNTFVNSLDIQSNRASSNFDERHSLAMSFVYQVPVKRVWNGLSSWADSDPTNQIASHPNAEESSLSKKMLEGWEFSGIVIHQSGTPFSIINGGSPNGVGVPDTAGVVNNIGVGSFADVVGDPHASVASLGIIPNTVGPLLGNPNAFAAPRGLTFGDAGRNSMNNPARTNFDLSVLKNFQVAESKTLEFRIETFNTFNHTQFRIYNPDRGDVNNTISCYGGPNNLAGYVGNGENCLAGNDFLHPVDAHRPRTVQLGLKFNF